MQTFRFRLQSLLEWRQARLESEQDKLAQLDAQVAGLEARATNLEQKLLSTARELSIKGSLSGRDVSSMGAFLDAMRGELKRAAQAVVTAKVHAERQRTVVMKAGQEHRALELLKEKQLGEWRYEADRELEQFAAESHLSARHRAQASE